MRIERFVLVALALLLAGPAAAQQTRTVGPGGDHATVTAALDAAGDGDRIVVRSGTYRESPIHVTRSVTLEGQGWPVLDGEHEHPVLIVEASDVTIRGFVVRNSAQSFVRDHAGIRVERVSGCTIENNRLRDNFFGIYLARAGHCRVAGNDIRGSGERESSTGNAIHLWNASDVVIEGNTTRGHRDGLYLEHSNRVQIRRNVSEGALRYGLHFMYSHETVYADNVFRNNRAGVAVMFSKNVEIARNRFEDNWGASAYGLLLKEMRDSEVHGNVFRGNTVGLMSEGTQRTVFRRNTFTRNGWAARVLSNSRENRFEDNNFIENSFDVTTDTRQNFNTFAGNFWSRYSGYDLTGDVVGDVPHRPVRLFGLIVERNPSALVLLRSVFVDLLDAAERVLPVLTPQTLVDERPRMKEVVL
jgi:nitrous oxidase accessory protein